jgi:hypothetical protein
MDLKGFAISVSVISETSELMPVLFFFKYAPKRQPFVTLCYYFVLSALIKISTTITMLLGIHNLPLFHLLVVAEVTLLYSFYARIIYSSGPQVWVIAILIILSVLNTVFIEDIYQFNSLAWTISIIFLLSLGLRYLYKLYDDLENIQLNTHPLFIINTGFLIYFAGSLFTYIFASEILAQEAKGFFHNAWIIQGFSNIAKNIIISYGLWLAKYN